MKSKRIKESENCLFVNCLGNFLTLILISQKGVFSFREEAFREQANLLVTSVSLLLKKAGLQLQDINKVYFLRGYGSIMGYHAVGTFVNVLALLNQKLSAFLLENHI
jgi:tRNA A37 threonylcarbamoyladenosine modification protein TsaB